MLNTFPNLLTYGFFAPTLLRIAVAATFFYLAMHTWRHQKYTGGIVLPVVGAQQWMPAFVALVECALAVMFAVGWHTQIAALVGVLVAIKYAIYRRFWPGAGAAYIPLSASTIALMFVICLSLLISGAGALAYDLPL
ncbi:MAG: DoxX family membrane protein [Patescibacteria group bacterium]|nr:DoxX family membrane protein [Patescibacteria group bacterium]